MTESRFTYRVKKEEKEKNTLKDYEVKFNDMISAVTYVITLTITNKNDTYNWDHICLNLLRGIPVFIHEYWITREENHD